MTTVGSEGLERAVRTEASASVNVRAVCGPLVSEGLLRFVAACGDAPCHLIVAPAVEPLEVIAARWQSREIVTRVAEERLYPTRTSLRELVPQATLTLREGLALLDQTDEIEQIVARVRGALQSRRLRLSAQPFPPAMRVIVFHGERGPRAALLAGSGLLVVGAESSGSLHVVTRDAEAIASATAVVDAAVANARDWTPALSTELESSWPCARPSPHDVYLKMLLHLVRDRLETSDDRDLLWDDDIQKRLADFQRDAVRQAVAMVRKHGGCFVADVVGLGKSFIGAAILKQFEQVQGARPVIFCPASLVPMWERYNETFRLNARVISTGMLRDGSDVAHEITAAGPLLRDRDLVLIDESHNFRRSETQRYQLLQSFLASGRRAILLTATPRNTSAWDVYHQLKLFHPEEKTHLPVSPPDLNEYFRAVESGTRRLADLLVHVLIRRTRRDILRRYGRDEETGERIGSGDLPRYLSGERRAYVLIDDRRQFFPRRTLETVGYALDDTYSGFYDRLRHLLDRRFQPGLSSGRLLFARYDVGSYLKPERRGLARYARVRTATANLAGLVRVLLFKRLESSVEAFRATIGRMITGHRAFLEALDRGGPWWQKDGQEEEAGNAPDEEQVEETLRTLRDSFDLADLDVPRLRDAVRADLELLGQALELVRPITPSRDAKLQTLLTRLDAMPLREGKRLIFTEFADTARYLYDALAARGRTDDVIGLLSGREGDRGSIVGRFAPRANPDDADPREPEIRTLVTTDVLAEGQNLQDADKVVNYDLHWNPVRLIQRFGRVDRIGTTHDRILAFNFLPERELERSLGLTQRLRARVREIHDTIGEDAEILEPGERINEEAMYAIYSADAGELAKLESEDALGSGTLAEAEALLDQLRSEHPEEFERIAGLRDGIRAARLGAASSRTPATSGTVVLLEAGNEHRLAFVDTAGRLIDRDPSDLLRAVACEKEEPAQALPADINRRVTLARTAFAQEVERRGAERIHRLKLTLAQKYAIDGLRAMAAVEQDPEAQERIQALEGAFRAEPTAAVSRHLRRIRQQRLAGGELFRSLAAVYHEHGMQQKREGGHQAERPTLVRVLCSMHLGKRASEP